MRKSRRFVSILLILCLILCTSCGILDDYSAIQNNSASANQTPCLVGNISCHFPLTDSNEEINIMMASYDAQPQDDVLVWERYEEMTGVNVNWTIIAKSDREESVYMTLTNYSDIDLFLRCRIPASDLTTYGANGLVLDLMKDDMLETYAPNCWSYLQTHPDALASVMNPDGSIYSLPQVNSGAELRVSRKIFINKCWLEQLNCEIPTTTEEFYNMLLAFKKQDPNQNGEADELPLCSTDWLGIEEAFYGAFGLANRGVHNSIIDYDNATDGLRFIAASDEYRDFLEYFNRLYSEELMDNTIFTTSKEQWLTNIADNRVGVFVSTNLAFLPAEERENWVCVDTALVGPNGDQMWTAIRANFHSVGAAVIPSSCNNPALVLQWLDYFWTDEGTLFYHMGVEGETFVCLEDGTYDYAPSIYEQLNSPDASFDDVISQYSPYPGGNNPTVEIAPYFMGGEMSPVPAQAARRLFAYGPEEYWPSFTFTESETATINSILPDLDKYCSDMEIAFITGEKPLTEWDSYISQLNDFRKDELLSVYQLAVDRYELLKVESGN